MDDIWDNRVVFINELAKGMDNEAMGQEETCVGDADADLENLVQC